MAEIPDSVCLGCGKSLDRAERLHDEKKPRSGDINICLYCAHIMIFDDKLTVRNLTDAEIIEIAGDSELLDTVAFIQFYNMVAKMG